MTILQKAGGVAALYMAAAYAVGIAIFLVVLDYPHMTEAAQRVELVVGRQPIIFATNLVLYVVFGIGLVVFVLALHERLRRGAPVVALIGTMFGIIWAGSLIASGMVANAGIDLIAGVYAADPAEAARTWAQIEAVANGLGNGNGEILGGVMTALMGWGGLRAGEMPKLLNYLAVIVGTVGIVSIVPGLVDLAGLFGIGQALWFVGTAFTMLRSPASPQ